MLKRFHAYSAAAFLLCAWLVTLSAVCPAETRDVRVRHVIDGDTIVLSNGDRVRYRGVNTPEIRHEDSPGEPLGWEAARRNRQLVQDRSVKLVIDDRERRDRFGRLLASVFLRDGTSVSEVLVREGLAFVCLSEMESPFSKWLVAAQRKAIDRGLGLWALRPARPEAYYLGNTGSLRFHRPTCPYAKKMRSDRRVIFRSVPEAAWAGYCRCKKCLP
jgi:micrococcal nuclease